MKICKKVSGFMSSNNVKMIAEKWEMTERHIQRLCKNGEIKGAQKIGRDWIIPETAEKPIDKRTKQGKIVKNIITMPKKTPFLDMTNLYHTCR